MRPAVKDGSLLDGERAWRVRGTMRHNKDTVATSQPRFSRLMKSATEEQLDEIERETRRLGSPGERAYALIGALRRRTGGDETNERTS